VGNRTATRRLGLAFAGGVVLTSLLLVACGSDDTEVDFDAAGITPHEDAGNDAHADAGSQDATLTDATEPDAVAHPDAEPDAAADAEPDAESEPDAEADAEHDATADAPSEPHDAGADAHAGDSGAHDAGAHDAGPIKDAGAG
jgi:hypothetical protein